MKPFPIIASVLLFFSALTGLYAQTYPYWDAAHPSTFSYYSRVATPAIAYEDTVYVVTVDDDGAHAIDYWTPYGGWQLMTNITVIDYYGGVGHPPPFMTTHDHYLYAVGSFLIGATTTKLARYDFYTGAWSALGDSFTATNVMDPTCIAVDTNNNIYVGFYTMVQTTSTSFPFSLAIDMLDVSTNDGATWSPVGSSLNVPNVNSHVIITDSDAGPDWHEYTMEAGISVLHADGTNLYVGGDFTGSGGLTSSNLIQWDGTSWHSFGTSGSGVSGVSTWKDLAYEDAGIDVVNAIETIGTNVYVAGYFNYPANCFARFSAVTGESLPTGDPAGYMGWPDPNYSGGGFGLAVNNGNLYFGGVPASDLASGSLAVSSDPTATTPSWSTNVSADSGDTLYSTGFGFLAAARDGNSVFVHALSLGGFAGYDALSLTSDGFSRLVVSADVIPSASITSYASGTLNISGTPDLIWQVQSSSDGSTWTTIGGVTLSGGSATFTGATDSTVFYRLYRNGLTSGTNLLINLQMRSYDGPVKTGTEAIGNSSSDYWNQAIADDIGTITTSCLDSYGLPTPVNITLTGVDVGAIDTASYTDPLFESFAGESDGGDFQISVSLPTGTYDFYLYGTYAYSSWPTQYPTFQVDSGIVGVTDYSSYVGSTGAGNPTVSFTGIPVDGSTPIVFDVEPGSAVAVANGLQILRH